MKYIKSALLFLLVFLFIFGIFYLIGSFCEATFNLSKWDTVVRGFVSFAGGTMAFFGASLFIGVFYEAK